MGSAIKHDHDEKIIWQDSGALNILETSAGSATGWASVERTQTHRGPCPSSKGHGLKQENFSEVKSPTQGCELRRWFSQVVPAA